MDLTTFKELLQDDSAASELQGPLLALWKAGRDDWHGAHNIVQDDPSIHAAWIHAYLHRAEGDLGNAAYWYRRAGQPVASNDLEREWEEIATALLK